MIGIMDGFVMHMFYNEFYIHIFSTNSYAFSLRISCMYMARNYNYPTAVFFVYRFYKNLIKLLIIFYFIKNNNNDINDNEFLTSNFSIILLRKAEMKLSLSV